jgi:hypothetical protein
VAPALRRRFLSWVPQRKTAGGTPAPQKPLSATVNANASQNARMETQPKAPPSKLSILWRDLGWRKWVLALLFPVPMFSWWLTAAWTILFCILVWVMVKNSAKDQKLPDKRI